VDAHDEVLMLSTEAGLTVHHYSVTFRTSLASAALCPLPNRSFSCSPLQREISRFLGEPPCQIWDLFVNQCQQKKTAICFYACTDLLPLSQCCSSFRNVYNGLHVSVMILLILVVIWLKKLPVYSSFICFSF